jgi:hypothetical protein
MARRFSILWLLLPLLASGCVTHKLWTEAALDEWNEPAANPELRLFQNANHDDFLVVYEEFSERHYTNRTRAFFLHPNEQRLAQHRYPEFVNIKASCHLLPVPVFLLAPTNPPESVYAVTTNLSRFTIISGVREVGSYALPLYNDGVGQVQRIAWTPLTVTADISIVGGIVAIICWEGLAASKSSISVR